MRGAQANVKKLIDKSQFAVKNAQSECGPLRHKRNIVIKKRETNKKKPRL